MRAKELLDEATLSLATMNKRDNWATFLKKVQSGESFKTKTADGQEFTVEKNPELIQALQSRDFAGTPFVKGKSIVIPLDGGGDIPLSQIYKDTEFGGITGGKGVSERQETGLIEAINSAVETNGGPITLVTEDSNIKGVSGASKVDGTNEYGKEPYADLAIQAGNKILLVSAKGSSAPSIAGGGLAGLHNLDPNIINSALEKAQDYYKKNHKHLEGQPIGRGQIPEVYSKIADKYVDIILRGNKKMGGPIDYMYMGPMEVHGEAGNGVLKVNGALTPIEDYIEKVEEIYLRIRRRSQDQMLTFDQTDKMGYPSIFFAPGEGHRRIVVYPKNKVPKNAKPYSDDIFVREE